MVGSADDDGEPDRIAVFDIETEAWDRFVLGGLIDTQGRYFEARDPDLFFDEILAQGPGAQVYAWNGGRFDFLWFLEVARGRNLRCEIGIAGTRITRIQVKDGPTLKDACALIPLSLAQASAIAGVPLVKDTNLPCTCSARSSESPSSPSPGCGGYCSIAVGMSAEFYRRLSIYLKLDCEAALSIVRSVKLECLRSDYLEKTTIGGTAYATARRTCGFADAAWESDSYHLARSGYFGGRVECYRPRAAAGFAVDLNSAYPWALGRTALPTGAQILISGPRAGRAFQRGREGIYQADVIVPPMHVPPLPARVGDRVIFPVGRVVGAWTRIELAEALEAGCAVTRWGRAIVWEDAEPTCAAFVTLAWGRRADAIEAGNPGLKQFHKLVANSLTGKFAQQPEMERVILCPDGVKICPADGCDFPDRARCERLKRSPRCCKHACNGGCGAYRPLDRQGKLWASTLYRIPDCGHVHWAAYLTAATRIELRRQLLADGQGGRTAVYCDTDSVYSTERRDRRIGSDLGEWGREADWSAWRCKAPKVYRYEAAGKVVTACKGIPDIDPEAFEAFEGGAAVTSERGVMSLKTAARGESLFTRKRLSRASKADGRWYGGRRLGDDGITYPVTIEEFERDDQ